MTISLMYREDRPSPSPCSSPSQGYPLTSAKTSNLPQTGHRYLWCPLESSGDFSVAFLSSFFEPFYLGFTYIMSWASSLSFGVFNVSLDLHLSHWFLDLHLRLVQVCLCILRTNVPCILANNVNQNGYIANQPLKSLNPCWSMFLTISPFWWLMTTQPK